MLVQKMTDKRGEVLRIETDDNLKYILLNDEGEEIGNLILWDKPEENFYKIKDTFITTAYRGRGIWRPLMYYVLQHVKTHLKADGLLSQEAFRRPASDKAWKSIEKFAEIKLSKKKRKDYYLRDMKLESESFSILSFDEFIGEDSAGLKSATKKKREVAARMDILQNRVDKNAKKYEYYADKEEFEKKLIHISDAIKAEDDPVQKAKLREEKNKLEAEWKDKQAAQKSQIKAMPTK